MAIDREEIKKWLEGWVKKNNTFRFADDTENSKAHNYVQVIPWPKEKDPYRGWVHYEVIKRNEQWFAEFHIELYKCQGRDSLEKKLNETLNKTDGVEGAFLRGIFRDSYCANRYWRSRCPILTEDELMSDLNLLKALVDESGILKSQVGGGSGNGEPSVGIKTVSLEEVLVSNLRVPNYQRGYCWRMEDVRRMMNDVYVWQNNHDSGNYNIGTVVLKMEEINSQKKWYTIIDGQQRLTTFAMFARLLQQQNPTQQQNPALGKFDPGENNRQGNAIGYLVRARDVLKTFIDGERQVNLKRLSINVVLLSASESDDLAYLFFNHTNSLGKRLTDYELLKGHHLRFVDTPSRSVDRDAAAKKTVEIWNRLARPLEVGISDNSVNSAVVEKGMETILHKTLYRLRKWEAGERFSPWADDLPSHDLFHHFSTDDEPYAGVLSSARAVDYDSIVRDGSEFFDYAETYRWKFAAYLQTAAVGLLYCNLQGHSNDVLFDIIRALGFLFYDRFGEKYLPEALYCIAYRVSEIRNKGRVMRRYVGDMSISGISNWAMPSFLSSKINRANHESILFSMLLDPALDYKTGNKPTPTMKAYWAAVAKLISALESKMEVSKVKSRAKAHKEQLEKEVK